MLNFEQFDFLSDIEENVVTESQLEQQKKTFSKLINAKLGRQAIKDLCQDLRDGTILLEFIQKMAECHVGEKRKIFPDSKLKISNVFLSMEKIEMALNYLQENQGLILLSIDSKSIADGNPKITLALVWNVC